ncbi:hypothetical protein FRC07_005594 [Ceratobasidium sp. 392]|nr:hypothetical protein FRC07_005594 [Ceratobasidium sp. 392]
MDADAEVNREDCARSYPTIKFFPKGSNKDSVLYEIGRSEADLVKFLNEHWRAHRAVGGGMNQLLDEIEHKANILAVFLEEKKEEVKEEVQEEVEKLRKLKEEL